MRNGTDECGSRDPGIGLLTSRGNLRGQVVLIEDCAHLIVRDADRDVFIEWYGIVAPIVVEDVEAHDFPDNYEIVERSHRIRIVAAAADHAPELVPHLLNDEVLLVDANTEADPRACDVVERELRPRTGRDIATSSPTAGPCRRRRGRTTSRCACPSSSKDGDIARR